MISEKDKLQILLENEELPHEQYQDE